MDVLEANFPRHLPMSLLDIHHQQAGRARAITYICFRDYHRGAKKCKTSNVGDKGLKMNPKRFLKDLRRDLQSIKLELFLPRPARLFEFHDLFPPFLELLGTDIERFTKLRIFSKKEKRKRFIGRVKREVDEMIDVFHSRDFLESALEELEIKCANMDFWLPTSTDQRSKELQWPSWCGNKEKQPSKAVLQRAKGLHMELPIRLHHLPRGGRTIVEHWRKDVNEVVDRILEVNDSAIVKEQSATSQDTYFAKLMENGKLKRMMSAVVTHSAPSFDDVGSCLIPERLTSIAAMVELLEGVTHRTQGQRYFGMELRTFLDIPGMRAASKDYMWAVLRSGRHW